MTQKMTAAERMHAAVKGEAVDRVPFCFWHHFKPEGSGERLAAYTLEFFHQKFDLDIIKIMPDLPYPAPTTPFTDPAQLLTLPRLSMNTPAFREQIVCIRKLRAELGDDYPLLLTLFSPLTYLRYFLGKAEVVTAVRNAPEFVEQGLAIISANLSDLMSAAIDAGASGIFFSCMGATSAHLTRDEYISLGRPSDLAALEGARNGWLNTVHVHADPDQTGDQIYFDLFSDYPVSVISWSDRLTGPSLSEALTLTTKTLMGGLDERGPLTHGSEDELRNEILSAVSQTRGHRLILANGCSIPDDTPERWLHSARRLVDDLK
jgi:uroporphyrinogen decarboxylase